MNAKGLPPFPLWSGLASVHALPSPSSIKYTYQSLLTQVSN